MQVAVYRYKPTNIYVKIKGETYEKQTQDFVGIVEAESLVQAAEAFPVCDFTLAFYEVKDEQEA